MSGTPCAVVYRWEDAPEELRALSNHGGDEDWVVVADLDSGPWMMLIAADNDYLPGWGNASRFEVDDCVVLIFAHA